MPTLTGHQDNPSHKAPQRQEAGLTLTLTYSFPRVHKVHSYTLASHNAQFHTDSHIQRMNGWMSEYMNISLYGHHTVWYLVPTSVQCHSS